MMKRYAILLTSILTLASSAIAALPQRYELDVKEFNVLKVIEGINVDYRCNPDSAGKAVFTATADMASVLMFTNDKGKLSIQLAREDCSRTGLPSVTVYSSFLSKVENSGDSTVRVLSIAPAVKFEGSLIGNGRLSVRGVNATEAKLALKTGNGVIVAGGQADKLKISFSGTGTIQADDFKALEINIKATGTGAIGCNATDKLSVFGAGSTKVYYKGDPQISNKSLGIKVLPLDGEER